VRAFIAFAVFGTLAIADGASVPADFQLRAKFFPGGSWTPGDWNPWHLTINADGSGFQETSVITENRRTLKKTQLSKSAVLQIVTAFRNANFFSLPEKVSQPIAEHQMGISVKLTLDGHTRMVIFSVPATIRDRNAAKRFWQAWSVVAQQVPSPNRNREFKYWFHHNPL
jgi:hypothetical protein